MTDTANKNRGRMILLIVVFIAALFLAFGLERYPVYPSEVVRILLSRFSV